MDEKERRTRSAGPRKMSHIPEDSFFFEKIVPILLVFLGVIMLLLVLFAVAVVAGLVKF